MKRNRRKFILLSLTGAAAAATYWAATSRRRSARWLRTMLADARRPILPAPVRPKPAEWSDNKLTICWLGHATVLINFFGIRILTDPALFSRVGIRFGLGTVGPKRYIAAALKPKELPPIDLILLSHAHLDHMDLASLAKIRAPIITAKDTRDILSSRATELGWNERTILKFAKGDLQIEAIEVKHWGQRWPSERERGYNGYILRREGKAIVFGGDTAHTRLFADLQGPFEAAIMPIAAYRPWIRNHCTPEQALEMANWAGAKYIVPVHHQTFRLSEEPMNEPIERLTAALASEPERLGLRRVGESLQL